MLTAIVRDVSPKIGNCELTHLKRERIDFAKAKAQHAQYKRILEGLGIRLVNLEGGEALPDGVFVEDIAVVVEETAVINRPGAQSRRQETEGLAEVLGVYRPTRAMTPPATLDGGDVLRVGRTLFVGRTPRTNSHGVEQLRNFLSPHGYRVQQVAVRGCLHLKSACCYLGRGVLIVNRSWLDISAFAGMELLDVHPEEPWAGNALLVNDHIVYSSCFPKTLSLIKERGFVVRTTDNSELMKAESALTCMSILFDDQFPSARIQPACFRMNAMSSEGKLGNTPSA